MTDSKACRPFALKVNIKRIKQMRIIHTSDLHIDSPLTSNLTEPRASERRRELIFNFERLIKEAREIDAKIIIIAGDLFDSERIARRAKDTVLAAVERATDIAFLYLPGNHERYALLDEALPSNLHVFGKDWTYFETDSILFAGRSECAPSMFDSYTPSKSKINIVILHGEEAAHSGYDGKISFKEIEGKNISYLALGHYHSYSKRVISGCSVVYSGTPEGRGFDETGDKGFSLIECKDGTLRDGFVKFAKRRLFDLRADISDAHSTADVERAVEATLSDAEACDLVRLTLVGKYNDIITKNTDGLSARLGEEFYYFEIRDESRAAIKAEAYKYDKSLKGEFIRLVLSDDTLGEDEKEKIILTGLYALDGEIGEELTV